MNDIHEQRIIKELKSVGVSRHGLTKPESRELPRILREDEHIGGVIYGRTNDNSSAMLVATNLRVLFLDNQFLFKTTDELTYDLISGVASSTARPFSSVVLHTKITDYTLRFVNVKCAEIFKRYIEEKCFEQNESTSENKNKQTPSQVLRPKITDKRAEALLRSNDLAVLSTVDRTGNVHGAVVYYTVDQNGEVFILTKSDTGKGRNVYSHSQVALTIYETGTFKTLQVQGIATIETDQIVREDILVHMTQPRKYKDGLQHPPVTRLRNGAFMVIKITPSLLSFHDYT